MFFPLRDHNPTRSAPVATYLLIGVNLAVYVWSATAGDASVLHASFGMVPRRLSHDAPIELITILTSMFIHGGAYHLASNLWFLQLFGDNIEDYLGSGRYLVFYLSCGALAALSQVVVEPDSAVPMIGASGAIGGVVGGYLMLHPRAPVVTFNMMPLLWLILGVLVVVPAWVIAFLFLGQNLVLAFQATAGSDASGVAFAAHLGGFSAGLLLIRLVGWGRPRIARHLRLRHAADAPAHWRRL